MSHDHLSRCLPVTLLAHMCKVSAFTCLGGVPVARLAQESLVVCREEHAEPGNRSGSYWLHQPVYDPGYVDSIAPKHKEPKLVRGRPVEHAAGGAAGTLTIILTRCMLL